MGALVGVGDVQFDCKTATVTMKGDATLTAAAAEKALKEAGFPMKSFAGGAPPTLAVVRASLRTNRGETPTTTALALFSNELLRELPEVAETFVEPDGRLTLEGKAEAKLDATALAAKLGARLERSGLVMSGVDSRSWPRTATIYLATLRGAGDDGSRTKARAAIEAIDNVVAAFERDDGPWLVVTKEPCANVAARLQSALRPLGVELGEVRPR